jgi:hypothetical protein
MQQSKTVVTTAMLFATIIATTLIAINQLAYAQEEEQESYTVQKTETSTQDPLPGHESHQIVLAAPPREDGMIYSGVATFSASQPVEVVVLHGYNPTVAANQTVGEPLTAPFADGQVAISLMKQFTDTPINAGSLAFTGNALGFHTLDGKPFSITYTVDAEIKEAATTATTTTTEEEEES